MLFPAPMPRLPQPGQLVRWRNLPHAQALGWADAYGPGPFVALGVVDKSHHNIPAAVVLHTRLGVKEVNQVWLALARDQSEGGEPASSWQGYSLETLLSLDA